MKVKGRKQDKFVEIFANVTLAKQPGVNKSCQQSVNNVDLVW